MAIARAILRDPAILLLDEATSALDPQTEAAVNATLDKLAPGRTTVSVTHRLTSAMRADRIFVLDRGSLVESGTHAELLERQGTYARMWQQQHGVVTGPGGQMAGGEAARLQAVPLFENLDGILLAALASRFVTERYAEGATIFEAGAAGDKLYVIVRGQVEVLAKGPGGRERSLAVLRDGDYFGEIALLEDVARTATIRARVPTVVLALDRQQFVELLDSLPDLRAAFDEVVAARRRATLAVLAASAS
jgi:ATP-binding cassette subfamily B protein